MGSENPLPVVIEERIGADAEERTASVYCRRRSGTVALDHCASCPRLGHVEHTAEGGLAVICNHSQAALEPGDAAVLRRAFQRVTVGDARAHWFVTSRRWTSAALLAAQAPPEVRWAVVTNPDGFCEGVIDLRSRRFPRGATAGDVMRATFVRLSESAPIQEAFDALGAGSAVVVAVDARGRVVGIFDTKAWSEWLDGALWAGDVDDTVRDGRYVCVDGRIEMVAAG